MDMPNINKENLLKHIIENSNSQSGNTVDKNYSSYVTTRKGLSLSRKKVVPNDETVTTYNPDTNGWCGYCSLYFGCVWSDEMMANHGGSGVRFQLLSVLDEHLHLFNTFFTNCYQPFGIEDTVKTLRMSLSVIPDETNQWWLTIPDSIWLAVLRFKVSIAVYTKTEGIVLYKHIKPVSTLPVCLLELKQDHFLCHVLPCLPLNYTLHPFQSIFDTTFESIL